MKLLLYTSFFAVLFSQIMHGSDQTQAISGDSSNQVQPSILDADKFVNYQPTGTGAMPEVTFTFAVSRAHSQNDASPRRQSVLDLCRQSSPHATRGSGAVTEVNKDEIPGDTADTQALVNFLAVRSTRRKSSTASAMSTTSDLCDTSGHLSEIMSKSARDIMESSTMSQVGTSASISQIDSTTLDKTEDKAENKQSQ